jgi:flagellar biosynthesis GTPase FlhF
MSCSIILILLGLIAAIVGVRSFKKKASALQTALWIAAGIFLLLIGVLVLVGARQEQAEATRVAQLEARKQEEEKKRRDQEHAQQLADIREKPEAAMTRAKQFRKEGKFTEALDLLEDVREAIPGFRNIDQEIARTVQMNEESKRKLLIEQQRKKNKEERAAKIMERRLMEGILRERYLDAGLDIKVKVSGDSADRIKLTYVLFNDVWSHRLSKEGMVSELCNHGFKRIEMSDGYNWGVYWTCT